MKKRKVGPSDQAIMLGLISQVQRAARGASEVHVTTLISKPMWEAFCRATGMPKNSKPTEWLGIHKTKRVFGSETILVKSRAHFAISFRNS
jgi:hypothetical protein